MLRYAKEKISLMEFAQKYEIKIDNIHAFLYNNPKYKEIENIHGKKRVFIKEEAIISNREFNIALWHFNTYLYFILKDIYKKDNQIARKLSEYGDKNIYAWATFISQTLFCLPEETIFNIRVSKRHLLFAIRGMDLVQKYLKEKRDEKSKTKRVS